MKAMWRWAAIRQTDPVAETGRPLGFLVPGDITQPTGGYAYARALLRHLPAQGWAPRLISLPEGYPWPDVAALAQTEALLAQVPRHMPLLVDGLCFAAVPPAALAGRAVAALIHHPLAQETGLSAAQADHLKRAEAAALARAGQVAVASPWTGRTLCQDYGVPADRITVALPGTPRKPQVCPRATQPVQLLSVATITRRKGHDILLKALAALDDLPWHLSLVGSLDRDPDWAAQIARQAAAFDGRVSLTGSLSEAAVDQAYARADLVVMASRHEGYGMAHAEALVRGLPIVTTAAGAAQEVVPPAAGAVVPVDDPAALAAALRPLLSSAACRAQAARAAWSAGHTLPDWPDTAAAVATALTRLPVPDP